MSSSNSSNPTSTPSSNNDGRPQAESVVGEQQPLDINNLQTPQTLDEALNTLSKLHAMKDSLLEEKKRNDAFLERYQKTVSKKERLATLHQRIPRQLFVREDAYQRELEKVSQWSGISDQEIADIYQRKLSDASADSKFRHHGASTAVNKDPYAGFREIPDFSKVNGKSVFGSSDSSNNVLRSLDMMGRISSNYSS